MPREVLVQQEGNLKPELRQPNREVGNAVLALLLAACSLGFLVLLGIPVRFCLQRCMCVWPALLYAGGGLVLLTQLNLWNATRVG